MNQQGIKRLEAAITRDHSNIAGMLVLRNGAKEYERYFNGYAADAAFHMFSATKSIISLLFGIALDKGLYKKYRPESTGLLPGLHAKERRKNGASRYNTGHADHDGSV